MDVTQLLGRGDELVRQWQRHYSDSLVQINAIRAAGTQHANLVRLASRNSPSPSLSHHAHTLARLQRTEEEASQGVRDCLDAMDSCVASLGSLLFEVDVFLSQPSTVLQYGLNPTQALAHLSNLHGAYQAELLVKRNDWADYSAEDFGVDELIAKWKECREIKGLQEDTMDDLASAMGSWGA